MINIEIGNSECKVTGADSVIMTQLKAVLSYDTVPAMNFYTKTFSSQKRTLMSKQGVFPAGLVKTLLDWLQTNNIQHRTIDTRKIPKRREGMFKLNLEA
jgi:hypothetical protein